MKGVTNMEKNTWEVKLIWNEELLSVRRSKITDLDFAEFNGFPGKNEYEASPKLAKRIAAQLDKPFMFEYANGHVGDILASAEVSTTVVNIVRGILEFFQVTVKTTQNIYDLEEVNCSVSHIVIVSLWHPCCVSWFICSSCLQVGIHGKCQSNYAIEENSKTNDWTITQVVDVTNCREKAEVFRGMANTVEDQLSKEVFYLLSSYFWLEIKRVNISSSIATFFHSRMIFDFWIFFFSISASLLYFCILSFIFLHLFFFLILHLFHPFAYFFNLPFLYQFFLCILFIYFYILLILHPPI